MKLSKPVLIASLVLPVLLAAIAGLVYLLYNSMASQQKENEAILHKFGFTITPNSPYTESTGVLGGKQLPATFAEDALTPVEKVIQGLIKDREQLLEENSTLQQKIDTLQAELEELERYKALNEQFAPLNFEQELAQVREALAEALARLPENRKFSRQRLELMTTASMKEYQLFVEGNHLLLTDSQRETLVGEHLVTYSFCIGNAIELAINSPGEALLIADWFDAPEQIRLPAQLRADLDIVLPPCRQALHSRLQTLLPTTAGG